MDIKDETREQAEEYGTVTNVIMYDLEADGVIQIRFSDPADAKRFATFINGKKFDGVHVIAYVPQGNERFRKSGKASVTAE